MKATFLALDYDYLTDLRGNMLEPSCVTRNIGMVEFETPLMVGDLVEIVVYIGSVYYNLEADVASRVWTKDCAGQKWEIGLRNMTLTPLEDR